MWTYDGVEFDENRAEDYYGFIYIITQKSSGRKYIGRKFFTKAGYRQVKGKRKKCRKPSGWKTYYGSSPELLSLIEKHGKDDFSREIIRLCKTLGETKYWETKLQFHHNVLEAKLPNGDFEYINGNIAIKYTRKNIGEHDTIV